MKLIRILPVLCFVVTMMPVCADVKADTVTNQSYLIPVDRPEKVGNKYRLESHATIKVASFAMADGKTYREGSETGAVDLIGTMTVIAVASNGGPASLDILIDECVMTTNGMPAAVVKRGDRVTMEKQTGASNITVRLNDVALDQRPAFLITSFLSVNAPDSAARFSSCYGLDVRREVGERWKINPALFAKYMKMYNPNAKEGDYSGTIEFAGITRTNDAEWANVRFDMTSVLPPPGNELWKTTGYRVKTVMSLALPLGDKPLKQSGEIDWTQKMWMESDFNNYGIQQRLLYNTVSKYRAVYAVIPIEVESK